MVKRIHPKDIINRVEKALDKVKREFGKNPARFFTESDVRCFIVRRLEDRLRKYSIRIGKTQLPLVHTEYPTPFKCDMSGGGFKIKPDKSSFRRGHFDIVILNPQVASSLKDINLIRAQRFDREFIRTCNLLRKRKQPLLLYAIELMNTRIKGSTEKKTRIIVQDFRKIKAAVDTGFAMKAVSLAFETADTGESKDTIIEKLQRELRPDLSEHARCEFIPYKERQKTLT